MKKLIVFLVLIMLGLGGWFLWDSLQGAGPGSAKIEQTNEIGDLPDYTGDASVEVGRGRPGFAAADLQTEFYQKFSSLDGKGRCGPATAVIDQDHMPEGERGSIGMIRPSGWRISKYDFVDGKYLFNRCHLIGWQLTGENAEERNLITGTRYMNVEGMLPYENQVAAYVRRTGNHVLYRVTPIFCGKELVCRGVQMEAESVEDQGNDLSFNVFCYNVQPGVEIDYLTGDNHLAEGGQSRSQPLQEEEAETQSTEATEAEEGKAVDYNYILNTNTHRFHYPDCSSVQDMKEHNKKEYSGSREDLIEQGYRPCGNCKP